MEARDHVAPLQPGPADPWDRHPARPGLVGIDRAGPATVGRADREVLLGIDQRHLDFRASVRWEPHRVVLSTVVQVHDQQGRLYSAVVLRVRRGRGPARCLRGQRTASPATSLLRGAPRNTVRPQVSRLTIKA